MEDYNIFTLLGGLITIALIVMSLILWTKLSINKFKKKPLLSQNTASETPVDIGILIASIYFYLSTPIFFMSLADKFKYDIENELRDTQLITTSHLLFIIIAGIIYHYFYRDKRIAPPIKLETDSTDKDSEIIVGEEENPQQLKRTLAEQIDLGYNGFIIALLPVFLVLLATLPLRSEEKINPLLKLVKENPNYETFLLTGFLAVVLAPLIEELIFRVIIQGFLKTRVRLSSWVSILTTAILFSLVHGLPDAFPLIPLALVLGYIYDRTRSYLAVVFMHASFNGYNLLMMGLGILAEQQDKLIN